MKQQSPSKYFNNYAFDPRQKLTEDLIAQMIRQRGLILKYLPRNRFERNHIFGEDIHSTFDLAVPIEAIPKTVDSFEGEGNILSRYGLEVRNQITFTISKRRWPEMMRERLVSESGVPYENEDTPYWMPEAGQTFLLEDGDGDGYNLERYEPRAGDLIYLPMNNQIFEITYVDREALFYQHGRLYTYDIKCELFKYSSEEFKTGIEEIDRFEDIFNLDQSKTLLTDEENNSLSHEDGFSILVENQIPRAKKSDNEDFQREGELLVNFSDTSPFIRQKKW